jgi:SSS family solute:Na+ symporter
VVGIPLVAIMAVLRLAKTSTITLSQVLSTPFIPPGLFSRAVFIIIPFLLSISVSYDAFMRYQSAKSAKVAQWGSIIGGIIVIFISFCIGLIGSIGKILFPSLENASVLPQTIQTTLSPVLAGIVVAALLAAVMSTGNCLLISLAGCFSRDLYNKVFNPDVQLDKLKHSKTISRVVILIAAVVGIFIAFQAKGILYTIIIFNYPYMGSMLIPLLGGVLWPKATTKGAIAAVFTGGIVGVAAFIIGLPSPWQGVVNIDLGLFIAYAVSAVVFVGVSLTTQESKL